MARVAVGIVTTAAALVVAPADALGEPAAAVAEPARPLPDPAAGPGFVNLQRFDATSRAGLELSTFRGPSMRRWDFYAQYVDPTYRVGGYVRLPYSVEHHLNDDPPITITNTMIGNLALGAIWVPRLAIEHVAVVAHAGVAAPVDTPSSFSIGPIAALMRPHELYASLPGATTLGAGLSLLVRGQHVFARVDSGLEEQVHQSDNTLAMASGPAIHANGGIGFDQGSVSAAIEVSTLTIVTDQPFGFLSSPRDNFDSVDVLTAMALSLRYRRPYVQAYAAVTNVLRDQQTYYYGGAFTFGIEGTLR